MYAENSVGINKENITTTTFFCNMDDHNAETNLQSEYILM